MLIQSIQCDKCKKIIAKDSQDYFTISGELKRGKEYYTANNEDAHICVNCFIKRFNLMVATPRESFTPEKQGDILKRKIEDKPYTQQPRPFIHEEIRYEKPWDITCTGDTKLEVYDIWEHVYRDIESKPYDSDSYQICAGKTYVTIPSKDNPYPNQVKRFEY